MFVLFKKRHIKVQQLEPGQTIFLRPTPWKTAWQAGIAYIRRTQTFGFVYLSRKLSAPGLGYRREQDDVVVFEGNTEIKRVETHPLSFCVWLFYGIESFAYGFFERFWLWKWSPEALTLRELEQKIERLEAQIEHLMYREENDD